MSSHYEDWKSFDVLSNHLHIKELSDDSELTLSRVKPGRKWFAFCEYDEDFKKIIRIVMSHEDKASVFFEESHKVMSRISKDLYIDRKTWKFDDGIIAISSNNQEQEKGYSFEHVLSQIIDETINVPRIASEGNSLFACLSNDKNEHDLDILIVENKKEQYQVEGIELVVK